MRHVAVGLVYAYRYTLGLLLEALEPTAGRRCKYHPSCSQYAIDAFREFGLARGIVLAVCRLSRCNPWSHGGVDKVSDQRLFRQAA